MGLLLVELVGCATTDNWGTDAWNKERYREIIKESAEERIKDIYNGYKLISENNDLIIEKIDGSEKRKITSSPYITEHMGFISKDGKCILYRTTDETYSKDDFFIQPFDKDDSNKEKIDRETYSRFWDERFSVRQ
jgi:hypothetical protein